jgi:N6-adenosine-specific RNA methylase IME4
MKQEDAEEYTQALGQVVAGGYRMIAIAQRLGVPKALGLSTEDWVRQRLGGYVRYSVEERKTIVGELTAEGMGSPAIAGVLGVSDQTVLNDRKSKNLEPETENSEVLPDNKDSPSKDLEDEPAPLDLVSSVAATDEVRKMAEKQEKTAKRKAEKAARVSEIEEAEPAPLDSIGPFPVLYADPPWRYDYTEDTSRQVENHYPTMALDEIKKLVVPASEDAVLFMWVTSPKLVEGLDLLDAWGFEYRTCMVWVKDKIGMGYYARQQHEMLLIAKRGALPVPDPEDRPPSVIQAPRGDHSAKPDQVYELIERMYPLQEKCELFQRRPRPRWAGWGNQA